MSPPFLEFHNFFIGLKGFLNPAFFTTIFGALAATWMGARAAEEMAARKADRDATIKELRNINFAITLAASITNSLIISKKQNIASLMSEYFQGKQKFEMDFAQQRSNPTHQNKKIRVIANFQIIHKHQLPLSSLEKILIEKISVETRALGAFVALGEAIAHFEEAASIRMTVISEFQKAGEYTPFVYYGIKEEVESGIRNDTRYFDSMIGIRNYLDDGIFFGNLLCKDLQGYGEGLGEKFRRNYKANPPGINKINFDLAIAQGLFPFIDEYRSWLSGYRSRGAEVGKFSKQLLRLKLYGLFIRPILSPIALTVLIVFFVLVIMALYNMLSLI